MSFRSNLKKSLNSSKHFLMSICSRSYILWPRRLIVYCFHPTGSTQQFCCCQLIIIKIMPCSLYAGMVKWCFCLVIPAIKAWGVWQCILHASWPCWKNWNALRSISILPQVSWPMMIMWKRWIRNCCMKPSKWRSRPMLCYCALDYQRLWNWKALIECLYNHQNNTMPSSLPAPMWMKRLLSFWAMVEQSRCHGIIKHWLFWKDTCLGKLVALQ